MSEQQKESDFDFYMRFAKPFVLNLPNSRDRANAACWLLKLTQTSDEQLRTDYLKLLLFALQRKKMIGIFSKLPGDGDIEPLEDHENLMELALKIIEEEHRQMEATDGDPFNYMTAVSADLKEYAVAQKIDKFGAHIYYAVSGAPIYDWENIDHGRFTRPRNLDHSVFDLTSPLVDVNTPQECRSNKTQAKAELGKTESEQDTCKWLNKQEVEEPGMKPPSDIEEFDPFEGKEEIDQHLFALVASVKGAEPCKENDYSRNVEAVFGEGFTGAVAQARITHNVELDNGASRTDVAQGIAMVGRDRHDGTFTYITKSMEVKNTDRRAICGSSRRDDSTSRRLKRSPEYEGAGLSTGDFLNPSASMMAMLPY